MFVSYEQQDMTVIDDRTPDRSGWYWARLTSGETRLLLFHRRRSRSFWTDDTGVRYEVVAWREAEDE